MVQYSYFPGCNLKTDAKGFEETAIAVSKKLDAELVEMPNWNCCGTVHTLTSDNVLHLFECYQDQENILKHLKNLKIK
ncbi:MAG: heterodisulfide reductase-related iron-sulfur binding cluster [Candidatus Heimdallarchaeaceae archaeon]